MPFMAGRAGRSASALSNGRAKRSSGSSSTGRRSATRRTPVSSPHRSLPHRVLSWGEPRSARASISRWCNFARSKWQVERRIIDISGRRHQQFRALRYRGARPGGVHRVDHQRLAINGLAIINDSPNLGYSEHSHPPGGLENYYRQNVIGGPNAFVLVVEDFKSFTDTNGDQAGQGDRCRGPAGRWPDLLASLTVGQGRPEHRRQGAATAD